MRVKSKWSQKDRQRTLFEIGGALAFIIWRIAQQGVLNLENEGFQTDTNAQRLDIMAEFIACLVHLADRMTAEQLTAEERQEFITSLARHLADTWQENRTDAQGKGDYRQPFIELINQRAADYAAFSVTDGEPGFAFRRFVGENVRAVIGAKDNKWVTDQVMDIEVPETLEPLKKALRDLFASEGA
ncbi:MAG: hypothetical protein WBO57_11630 [Gammaproteobacteria bacterium]